MKAKDKRWRKFEEAREFVHLLRLKNQDEWRRFVRSGKNQKIYRLIRILGTKIKVG
jgi:hypothetical protein